MYDFDFWILLGRGNRSCRELKVTVLEKLDSVHDGTVELDFFKVAIPGETECVCRISQTFKMHFEIGDASFNQRKIGIQKTCLGHCLVPFVVCGGCPCDGAACIVSVFRFALLFLQDPDRDGENHFVAVDVADGAAVHFSWERFCIRDDFHCRNFWRTRDGTAWINCVDDVVKRCAVFQFR